MSQQQFIEYAEREGYKNIRIRRFKNKDQIWVETTPSTGYPNVKKIGISLRHHIEECPPSNYNEILMSQADRIAFRFSQFWEKAQSLYCTKGEVK